MATKTKFAWVRGSALGVDGDDRVLLYAGTSLCWVKHWGGDRWWWKTYDGKNTQLAGEPLVTLQLAKTAALKWAKAHVAGMGQQRAEKGTPALAGK